MALQYVVALEGETKMKDTKNKMKNVALIATIGIALMMLIPLVSATVSNRDIVNTAVGYEGQAICQCKCFVQKVVNEAGGNLGNDYTQCYLDAGTEIQMNQAMWGDIIQVSHNTDLEGFYDGMHTMIILENYGDKSFKVVDSNYNTVSDSIVRIGDRTPYDLAADSVHDLGVHFYRLGTTDHWDFNIPTYTQEWEASASTVVSSSVAPDGRYRIDPKENDPWTRIDNLFLNANDYNAIEINMASNCPDGNARIYFTTESSPSYSESKMVEFEVSNYGDWSDYTIYMGNHNLWKGTITGIRIDPAESGRSSGVDTVGFDYIKIVKTDKKSTILDRDLDYFIYEGSDTLTFKYWINNPFANKIEDVRLGAQIRSVNSQSNWIDDWSSDKVVTLESGTCKGCSPIDSQYFVRYFNLPLSAGAGYYDAHWVILNHNTGIWYDNKEKANAFIINEPQPVIVDPTPTPTPEPTSNPPAPTSSPTPTPTPEPKPDLIISEAQIINGAFYSTTKNIGNAPSGSCWTGFYANGILKARMLTDLNPGETKRIGLSLSFFDVTDGDDEIKSFADYQNVINEIDETNNEIVIIYSED